MPEEQPGPIHGGLRGKIHVFGEKSFGGSEGVFYRSIPSLVDEKGHGPFGRGNWNDEITSFRIESGIWRFWENVEYKGQVSQEFKPGDYEDIRNYGFEKDFASSIELVRETPPR